jgi:hypothetical protein
MQLLHLLSHHLWALALTALTVTFLSLQKLFPLSMMATYPPFSRLTQTDIRRASIELTSAQILTLNGTPLTVVPAPGVGYRIYPLTCVVDFFGGGVAYTNGGGGFPEFLCGSAAYIFTDAASFLVTVSPNRRHQSMSFAEVLDTAANPPTSENAPLTFSKATAEFAAGTGTARVTVYYTIEPCAP